MRSLKSQGKWVGHEASKNMEQYPAQRVGGAECAVLSFYFLSGLSFSPLPVFLPFCIKMSQVRAQRAKKVDEKQCKKLYTKTSPLIANCH